MSHIVTVKTEVKDREALEAARQRLKLKPLEDGTFQLFSGPARGTAVQLNDWKYPAVVNLESGEVKYDNYHGSWGKQIELDKLIQAYTVELGAKEARSHGFTTEEVQLDNGDIKLTLTEYATT